jgi:hypothetical protein
VTTEDFGVPREAYLAALKRERAALERAGHARRLAAVDAELARLEPPVHRQATPVETAAAAPKPVRRPARKS